MMIYLASQSLRRREILRDMKIRFRVAPSHYQERFLPGYSPSDLVLKHAMGKVLCACVPRKARYVLGADTLVWRGKFYGKPRTVAEAKRMLASLSGKVHEVHTGVVVLDRVLERCVMGTACTKVRFRTLSRKDILTYLSFVDPLDKAGAYAIQEGPGIVKNIRGSYSNVVGLPRELVRRLLKKCVASMAKKKKKRKNRK